MTRLASRWTDIRSYIPPIRPTTAERIIIARRWEWIESACIGIAVAVAVYFVGQVLRGVL